MLKGIYGGMNYYGDLFKAEGDCVYYAYGCQLDNMTGLLAINVEKGTWINKKIPDGIEVEKEMFRSFANKVLSQCRRGEIRDKAFREIS